MGLLSDAGIKRAMGAGLISIEPFDESSLTPNGYDLSIAELMLPDTGVLVGEGHMDVPPMSRLAISTREFVRLSSGIAAQLWLRTKWARKGMLASFGKVDAGFQGTITIGAFYAGSTPLRLEVGDRVCQICFEPMDRPAEAEYGKRSGTWQGQRGITIEPPANDPDRK